MGTVTFKTSAVFLTPSIASAVASADATLRSDWFAPRRSTSNSSFELVRLSAGLIRHSDRGVQYASRAYRDALSGAPSMSRNADCYDNVPTESFFHTLKTELVHRHNYETRAEAQRDIFAFIEGFYNSVRTHQSLHKDAPI